MPAVGHHVLFFLHPVFERNLHGDTSLFVDTSAVVKGTNTCSPSGTKELRHALKL